MTVRTRRVYEQPAADDGFRVLVDRLWPRGLRREEAHLDAWLKDVAPSAALRRWFGHDPARFDEFAERYRSELQDAAHRDALARLEGDVATHPVVTLLFGARSSTMNQAVVLADVLRR